MHKHMLAQALCFLSEEGSSSSAKLQPQGAPKAGPWGCATQPQPLQGQREGEKEPAQEGW